LLIALASVLAVVNIAKTIVGIGALIFVHELGHFLVGRWCGVHAEAFSIGFGPVLLKWRGKPRDPSRPDQVTEYRLSAIPLGGYVKFLGENPDERGERDPKSFHAATYPRKVAIMLAGVTMNVIAAFALFAIVYVAGWQTLRPVAGEVSLGSPAWEYGVRKGDEFVTLNGNRILDFEDIAQEAFLSDEVEAVLRRDGVLLPAVRIPTRAGGAGLRQIGVGPQAHEDGTISVEDDGAAAGAGFSNGDRVVAVDGAPVTNVQQAQSAHRKARRPTVWTLEKDGVKRDVTLPWATLDEGVIGVEIGLPTDVIVVQRGGPAAAAGLMSGDRLVSVGGVKLPPVKRLPKSLADTSVDGPLVVRRGDREIHFPLPAGEARKSFVDSIAMEPAASGEIHLWWFGEDDAPARAAGLPDGIAVVDIDGKPVKALADDVNRAVQEAYKAKRPVVVKWQDGTGKQGTTSITPQAPADLGGIGPAPVEFVFREPNPVAAVTLAADRTVRWTKRIFGTLGSLFTGRVGADKLSGPLAISTETYSSAKTSWGRFLLFLGMISMNLAVLNVLPVPLLDGGQLAVHTIERIRRKPIPERVLEGVMWAGLVLLLGLVVYVTRNDILHLMRN
jgi:regulator of sigma E protease